MSVKCGVNTCICERAWITFIIMINGFVYMRQLQRNLTRSDGWHVLEKSARKFPGFWLVKKFPPKLGEHAVAIIMINPRWRIHVSPLHFHFLDLKFNHFGKRSWASFFLMEILGYPLPYGCLYKDLTMFLW